jgi:hypothetical protein
MASTYTLNNGIELIGTGEQSGTWGASRHQRRHHRRHRDRRLYPCGYQWDDWEFLWQPHRGHQHAVCGCGE